MRVGFGYDVHAFTKGRKLILGGVEIPYEKGLQGHSDADVLTHAVMDALLGAAAMGDIGLLFPDSDSRYKDASSLDLLQQVVAMLKGQGFVCSNVDCTLVAEVPKLAPYREEIRKKLASVLEIARGQVSVKATTTEGLGFTGRKEGLSAYVCCLIKKTNDEE
ncbi:MAG: 2-C-methyl-D-erythritol 2,4-cyclodiphosphate synthase [Peptococcia bacterium]